MSSVFPQFIDLNMLFGVQQLDVILRMGRHPSILSIASDTLSRLAGYRHVVVFHLNNEYRMGGWGELKFRYDRTLFSCLDV